MSAVGSFKRAVYIAPNTFPRPLLQNFLLDLRTSEVYARNALGNACVSGKLIQAMSKKEMVGYSVNIIISLFGLYMSFSDMTNDRKYIYIILWMILFVLNLVVIVVKTCKKP